MEREILNKNSAEKINLVSIKELKEDLPKVIGRIDYNKEWILESKFLTRNNKYIYLQKFFLPILKLF